MTRGVGRILPGEIVEYLLTLGAREQKAKQTERDARRFVPWVGHHGLEEDRVVRFYIVECWYAIAGRKVSTA